MFFSSRKLSIIEELCFQKFWFIWIKLGIFFFQTSHDMFTYMSHVQIYHWGLPLGEHLVKLDIVFRQFDLIMVPIVLCKRNRYINIQWCGSKRDCWSTLFQTFEEDILHSIFFSIWFKSVWSRFTKIPSAFDYVHNVICEGRTCTHTHIYIRIHTSRPHVHG